MEAVLSREDLFNLQVNELMAELRQLVSALQKPRMSDHSWRERIQTLCEELSARLSAIQEEFKVEWQEKREEWGESFEEATDFLRNYSRELHESFQHGMDELGTSLRNYANELAEHPNAKRMQELYQSMASGYESLLVTLSDMKVSGLQRLARHAHLKPINYPRNLFHVAMGIGSVLLYQFVFTRTHVLWILGIMSFIVVSLEISRRYSERWNNFLVDRVFGKIARPFERHHINGSSYYTFALLITCFLFDRPVVQAGAVVLAIADPAATIVGKLWGNRKIFRDKSVIGTSAFFITAFAASLIFISLALPALSIGYALICALALAVTGTLAELFTVWVDDNFTIPIACSAMAFLLF